MKTLLTVLITLAAVGVFNIILYIILQESSLDEDDIYPKFTFGIGWILFLILKFILNAPVRFFVEFKRGSFVRVWSKRGGCHRYYCIKCKNPIQARVIKANIKRKAWVNEIQVLNCFDKEMLKEIKKSAERYSAQHKTLNGGVILTDSPRVR